MNTLVVWTYLAAPIIVFAVVLIAIRKSAKKEKEKTIKLNEIRGRWKEETDERVKKAANEDIEEYAPEVQSIIKEEAERRRAAQANTKPVPKQTAAQKTLSSFGLDYDPEETKDLQGAESLISCSLGAALLSASITLVLSVISCFGYSPLGMTPLSFIDVVVVFALAYGIYRKSRICAVIIFIYWVVGKIGQSIAIEEAGPLVAGVFFGFYFFQGIRGTFAYHRLIKSVDNLQDEKGARNSSELRRGIIVRRKRN